MKTRVLVTGGAGFIGSHVVERLLKDKYKVFVIDDLSGGYRHNLHEGVTFFECDLRDQQQAADIIAKIKPSTIFHLAANAAENKAQFSPIDISSRNYNAFINTLVPAIKHGLKRFVFTSSIAVYGAGQTPFKETSLPQPEDIYGVSMLMIEKSLEILSHVHNFEYVIVRPHNVYGPQQNMRDPYRNVVTLFMNSLLRQQRYHIYGNGEQRRCFSYIDDVVDALYTTATLPVNRMTFNIGSDRDYSLNELSSAIQKVTSLTTSPIYIADRPQEVKVATADHALAIKYLGYQDSTPLTEGLTRTWQYVQRMGPQEPVYTEVELDSPLLPSNWRAK
ncbi:MAG: SDR family NAD(P)-dependent oxidoreductase [bacterium]|nr:SDR family NAD(P)-dependent oxidoreductase [bacterium]